MRGLKTTPRIERTLRGVLYRLLWVFVVFGVGASLTWFFRIEVFGYLIAPAGGQLSATGKPIFLSPTEMFGLTISLAVKGGLVVAIPVLLYNIYGFFRPILSKQQRRTVLLFMWLALFFYLGGTAFAYYILLPTGLRFLLQFGADIATPMIRITDYLEIALAMLFWLGIVFELPLGMLLLAKLRLVSHERFKRFRRYVPIAALILGMIITPTVDPVNQTLVALPIIALFELGLFLSWMARPKAVVDEK